MKQMKQLQVVGKLKLIIKKIKKLIIFTKEFINYQ